MVQSSGPPAPVWLKTSVVKRAPASRRTGASPDGRPPPEDEAPRDQEREPDQAQVPVEVGGLVGEVRAQVQGQGGSATADLHRTARSLAAQGG